MKILVTNHWALYQNLGDLAIIQSMLSQLQSKFPNAEIVFESSHPEITKKYYPDLKLTKKIFDLPNFKKAKSLYSFEFIYKNFFGLVKLSFLFLNFYIFKYTGIDILNTEILKHYKTADLIIFAGGDYFCEFYAYDLRFKEIELIKKLNKPCVIYSQSIGPFSGKGIANAKKSLSKVDAILARDNKSVRLLKEYGVDESKIYKVTDCVTLMEELKTDKANKAVCKYQIDDKTIGFVFRDIRFTKIDELEYQGYIKGMLDFMKYTEEKGYKPLIVAPQNSDLETSEKVKKDFNLKYEIFKTRDLHPREVKYVFSKIKALVSPRMHPIIIASTAGTPVIGVGLEFKMQEYMSIMNLQDYFIPMLPFDLDKAKNTLNKLLSNYTDLKEVLQKSISEVHKTSTLNAEYTEKVFLNFKK